MDPLINGGKERELRLGVWDITGSNFPGDEDDGMIHNGKIGEHVNGDDGSWSRLIQRCPEGTFGREGGSGGDFENGHSDDGTTMDSLSCMLRTPQMGYAGCIPGLREDILLVLAITLLQEAGRGIQISSLFTYLEFLGLPRSSMGISVSLYSLGRMIAGVPFAYWSEISGSSRDTFVTGGIIAIVASVIYATSWAVVGVTAFPVFLSRFLLGACSGPISVTRSYLINHSKKADKTRLVMLCGLSQYIGFTISPMIVAIVGKFLSLLEGFQLVRNSGEEWSRGDRPFSDSIRERVILEAILSMFIFLLVNAYVLRKIFRTLPRFDLSTVPGGLEEIGITPNNDIKNASEYYAALPPESTERSPQALSCDPERKPYLAFVIYFFANLVIRGSIGVAETLSPQTFEIFSRHRAIFLSSTSSYFLILGLIGLPVYLLVDPLQKYVLSGPKLLAIGISSVAVGLFLTADPLPTYTSTSWPKFLLGTTLVWSIGSPMCQTLSTSLFSDYLQKRKQTAFIGWITAAGSVGRIVFPAIVGVNTISAYITSMISVALCIFCILGMYSLYGISLDEYS